MVHQQWLTSHQQVGACMLLRCSQTNRSVGLAKGGLERFYCMQYILLHFGSPTGKACLKLLSTESEQQSIMSEIRKRRPVDEGERVEEEQQICMTLEQEMAVFTSVIAAACSSSNVWTTYKSLCYALKEEIDSEDDKTPEEKLTEEITETIPEGTDITSEVLDSALKGLSARWREWIIRGIFTWLMIGGFCLLIYGGPLALMITTLVVQVKCFEEIINIGYAVYRIHGLPWFRSLSWYFLVTSNYFFYGESLVDYFGVVINRTDYLRALITYHRFFSFCLYIVGFVWFVLSLVKKYYMKQFSLFAWTHVALLIVVTQSYLIIQNIFEGLIWYVRCASVYDSLQ
uniref:phosphatidate cytidylyltransferase n=1 Tax=Timema monikensis TaxID=170555 RepID=A0A7R9HLU9_9NEOP|nr:unnamed protein product [Timema monikensis]